MRQFVGIDQSYTSCGVVILNEDSNIAFFGTFRAEGDDVYEKARNITSRVRTTIETFNNIQTVAVEGLAFSKFGNATRDLAGLQFVLINELRFRCNHNVKIVPPNSLKKFATGSGKAKKQEMVDFLPQPVIELFAQEKYKKSNGLYDLADAYWIAKYILDESLKDVSHQPAQRKSNS